jgi:hypothetical protein
MQERRRDQVVSRVFPRPSAGKLTARWYLSYASGVAKATIYRSGITPSKYHHGITPVSQSSAAGKLTDRRSPRATWRSLTLAPLLGLAPILAITLALFGSVTPALAAGDENMGSCANESLSGFTPLLPDCRAYEQVTPSFKAGERAPPISISSDGERVLGSSRGAFANTQSDQASVAGGFYEFTRTGSGWQPSAIAPAAAAFPSVAFIAASPNLERTLWVARTPAQSVKAEDLYVKEADGAMVEVGPVYPTSLTAGPPAGEAHGFFYLRDVAFHAASDDLSHVLFSLIGAKFWPGDTTTTSQSEAESLYEYVGLGNSTPVLVGVSDGSTKQEGKELPAGELISDCGTALGSEGEADTYNAVSAGGGTVFFTARGLSSGGCPGGVRAPGVSELFARVNGFKTVAVSEPLERLCGCESASSTPEPASFAGASENGLQVFFLSSQEYFAESKGVNLYVYDFDRAEGKKLTRISTGVEEPEVEGVARVSEDGSRVYFVAKGQLTKGPRGGGCLAELAAGEVVEEEAAAEEEAKEEAVTSGAKCRPHKGGNNLYVYERDEEQPAGRLGFVATLTAEDEPDWSAVDNRPVQATSDGRFLVFESTGELTTGDASSVTQLFEYDAQSEELVRVSIPQTGYNAPAGLGADANASLIEPQSFEHRPDSPAGRDSGLAVSGDGANVVFFSDGALSEGAVPAAEAGAQSVYEYHSSVASGGDIREGDTYLISDGKDTAQVNEGGVRGTIWDGLDVSGGDVFFESSDALVSGDGDSQYDLYDARAGGGFVPSVTPPACSGETCQGPPSPVPAFTAPSSASLTANSNLTPPPPSSLEPPAEPSTTPKTAKPKPTACKKGYVKKGTKCVKKNKKKKAKGKVKKK